MTLSIYDRLQDFGTMVYTVGDGSPHGSVSKTDVNGLSRGNTVVAADLVARNHDAILFIAGGNSGEKGKRGDGIPGSLREAERMAEYIRTLIRKQGLPTSVADRVMTDCDPAFQERYNLEPSGNTTENAQNAVAVLQDGKIQEADIVAEINHLARVIGTFRKQLHTVSMLHEIQRMTAHPVISSFEPDTEQAHIQSLENFLRWEWKVKMHHLLLGKVRRIEFAREWLAARWRTLKGTALLIPDDTGKPYAPDVLYPWMCEEPVDTRRS